MGKTTLQRQIIPILSVVLFGCAAGSGCKRERPPAVAPPGPEVVEPKIQVPPGPRYCHLRFGPEGKQWLWFVYDGSVLVVHRNGKGDDTTGSRRIEPVQSKTESKVFRIRDDGETAWLKGTEIVASDEQRDVSSLLGELGGGTVLTYEIDRRDGLPQLDSIDLPAVAAALKKRIDPADLHNIVIRPAAPNQVDIILPAGDGMAKQRAEVDRIKNLVQEVGTLEFRIVANDHDDDEAFAAAEQLFPELDAQAMKKLTWSDAVAGRLPAAPVSPQEKPWRVNGIKARYAWVEIGPIARADLGLLNKYEEWFAKSAEMNEQQRQEYLAQNLT